MLSSRLAAATAAAAALLLFIALISPEVRGNFLNKQIL